MWNAFETLCPASFCSLVLRSESRFRSMKHTFAFQTMVTNVRKIATTAVIWVLATIPFLRYGEVRRHEERMVTQQVSIEIKRKTKKAKKGLKTTSRILVGIFLCYIPILIFSLFVRSLGAAVPLSAGWLSFHLLATSLIVLSSFINPIIYTLRNTQFYSAMIQLLLKTDICHAEEAEKKNGIAEHRTHSSAATRRRQTEHWAKQH